MAKRYTQQEILDLCRDSSNDFSLFYSMTFINYKGDTKDTEVPYTEVIAGYLLENMSLFDTIKTITRQNSYKVNSHEKRDVPSQTNRVEEAIAIDLYIKRRSVEYAFGQIIDYQVPLKNVKGDNAGKIDLVSMTDNGQTKPTVYLLELKKPDSQESMLRCVLESYTYLKLLDCTKFISDYQLPPETIFSAAPLVFKDRYQYKQYVDKDTHKNLHELMNMLNVKPFFISE